MVDPVKTLPGLRQYQIVQKALDRFVIRFVSAERPTAETEDAIRTELRAATGPDTAIAFEPVDEIPRTPAGKYMTTVCEIA